MEFATAYVLAVILLLVLILWYKDRESSRLERRDEASERKELYDRLMARNFVEYKDLSLPEQNQVEPQEIDDGTIDLDDAKDEILESNNFDDIRREAAENDG